MRSSFHLTRDLLKLVVKWPGWHFAMRLARGPQDRRVSSCGSWLAGSITSGNRSCVETLLASQIGKHAG